MPLEKQALPVPLAVGENLGEDPRQSKALQRMINCYINRTGEIQTRPGISKYTTNKGVLTPTYHGSAAPVLSVGKGLVPLSNGNVGVFADDTLNVGESEQGDALFALNTPDRTISTPWTPVGDTRHYDLALLRASARDLQITNGSTAVRQTLPQMAEDISHTYRCFVYMTQAGVLMYDVYLVADHQPVVQGAVVTGTWLANTMFYVVPVQDTFNGSTPTALFLVVGQDSGSNHDLRAATIDGMAGAVINSGILSAGYTGLADTIDGNFAVCSYIDPFTQTSTAAIIGLRTVVGLRQPILMRVTHVVGMYTVDFAFQGVGTSYAYTDFAFSIAEIQGVTGANSHPLVYTYRYTNSGIGSDCIAVQVYLPPVSSSFSGGNTAGAQTTVALKDSTTQFISAVSVCGALTPSVVLNNELSSGATAYILLSASGSIAGVYSGQRELI